MEQPDNGEKLLQPFPGACRVGRGHAGVGERTGQLRGNVADTWFEVRDRLRLGMKQELVQRDGRIHYGTVVFEESHGTGGLPRGGIKGRSGTSRVRRTQHHAADEADVVDLVHARFDALKAIHSLGHMPSDGHTHPMGLGRYRLHHLRREAAVELHLLKAGVVIFPHLRHGLVRRCNPLNPDGSGRIAVDDTRQQHPRTDPLPCRDGIPDRANEVQLIAHVPHRRDAGGEVNRTPLDLFIVGMHVPQAW